MEKGQLCYLINSYDIEPAEFVGETSAGYICIKSPNSNISSLTAPYNVCSTKEEAYTKLLNDLEDGKAETEEAIEDLEDELDVINEAIRKLKQKYEI